MSYRSVAFYLAVTSQREFSAVNFLSQREFFAHSHTQIGVAHTQSCSSECHQSGKEIQYHGDVSNDKTPSKCVS